MVECVDKSTSRLLTEMANRQDPPSHYCAKLKLLIEVDDKRITQEAHVISVIQALLAMEPDIENWGEVENLGCVMARRSWVKGLELMLDAGLSPNAIETPDVPLRRSLLMAASCNSLDTGAVEMLINRGADLEQVDINGETAIFMAAFMSNPRAVEVLIARGSNVLHVDKYEQSPLFWCFVGVEEENFENVLSCAKKCLDAGADPNLKNASGELIMDYADSYGGRISHGFRQLMAELSTKQLKRNTPEISDRRTFPRL